MYRTDTLDLVHILTRTHKTTVENDDGKYGKPLKHAPKYEKHGKIEAALTSACNTH